MSPLFPPPDSEDLNMQHRKKIPPGLWVTIIILLFLVIIGVTLFFKLSNQPDKKHTSIVTVKAYPVRVSQLPIFYETVGSLESDIQVDIKPEVSGIVKHIYVEEGQSVSKGDLLVQLDHDKQSAGVVETKFAEEEAQAVLSSIAADYEAKAEGLKAAESEKKFAENEYIRYKNMLDREFVSLQDVEQRKTRLDVAQADYLSALKQKDSAKAKFHQAQAALESAKIRQQISGFNYSDTIIRAPFSGRVGFKQVKAGDYVTPAQNILTLVQSNPLKAVFSVPERYLSHLKSALPVELRAESRPDRLFKGNVVFVDPVVSVENRAVVLKAVVDNSQGELQPGQYVNVKLILGQKENALLIPEESLVPQGERYFVYVADKGKAIFRHVEIGHRIPRWIEVISGVKPGEHIIIAGIQKIKDGDTIQEIVEEPGKEDIFQENVVNKDIY